MLRGSKVIIVWVEEDQGPKARKRRKTKRAASGG
jgi:hypothetical protein